MKISRNIALLGMVSLFTDLSSQMIYPLLPKLLTNLGAGMILIGVIEGLAEASASILKPFAGKLSDRYKKRLPFVFSGYGLSAIVKPLFAFAGTWLHVLLLRFGDRVGKAIRNPPRDVLISLSSDHKNRGKSFGIHRAFDRVGSIGGPLLALAVFYFYPEDLSAVFLWAGIPAVLALVFIPFVRDQHELPKKTVHDAKPSSHQNIQFKYFLVANTIFTLGNSSNAFLILKASEVGFEMYQLPMLWAVYNIFCAISSPVMGSLSDRVGRLPVIIASFGYYCVVYILFAFMADFYLIWILFALYGVYYGLSKGVFKAYIADITIGEKRGWYYGVFEMWTGIALLLASIMMGFLWDQFGSQVAFLVSATFSLVGLIIFILGQGGQRLFKWK